jgi:hypothetical protein
MDDTNPALAFRPREREKVKKQRKNNLDSYQRLQQMRSDFIKLKDLLQVIQHRESAKREMCIITKQVLLQRINEIQVWNTDLCECMLILTNNIYRLHHLQP